jgi:hypothetical protein
VIRIGGSSGFEGAFSASIDSSSSAAHFSFTHAGGWSPLSGELQSYFVTPAFAGSLALNMPSPDGQRIIYLSAQASVTLPRIELVPGLLVITGLGEDSGPTIRVGVHKQNAGDAHTSAYAFEGSFQIGSGLGALPHLELAGNIQASGTVSLSMRTNSNWQPLASVIPGLTVPRLMGLVELRADGNIVAEATHEPLPEIAFGPIMSMTRTQVGVRLESVPARVLGRRLTASGSRSATSSGTQYNMRVNVTGGLTILQQISFTYVGVVDATSQSASLTVSHPGGWCPFASLGLTFCSPVIQGGFSMGRLRAPYLNMWAQVTIGSGIDLIPGVLTLTDPALGSGGPTFGVNMTQATRRSDTVFEVFYDGGVCIDMGTNICLPVRVSSVSPFNNVAITGTFTSGDIRPLFFLPGELADLVVIRANDATPLMLTLGIGVGGGCRLSLGLSATLRFNLPSIAGGGGFDLPVEAAGCAVGQVQAIFVARLPTMSLPGGLSFGGLDLILSTMSGNSRPTQQGAGFTLPSGREISVPRGISLYWAGASPLPGICPQEVLVSFTFRSVNALAFQFMCTGFSLTLLDFDPPLQIPSLNFIRFTAIGIFANVQSDRVQFGLTTDFMLATGSSRCESLNDAECLTATLSASVGVSKEGLLVGMSLNTQGAWIEPFRLRNFAIVDPQLSLGVTIPPITISPPYPNLVAWGITIYYKPDITNNRDNWPSEIRTPKDELWPPDLSRYTTTSLRQVSSYFLYEQWHAQLDDTFLRPLGLPRFAIKLYIPRLTLVDVMLMYADLQVHALENL